MPKRERYVWVCTNRRPEGNPKGSCAQQGSEDFHRELKSAAAQAGLASRVRVCISSCIDLCWVGAAVGVMPDMAFFKHVTTADVPAFVEALGRPEPVAEHPALREKVVQPAEFDDPVRPVPLGRRPG